MAYEKDVAVDNTPLGTDHLCKETLQGSLNNGHGNEVFIRNKDKEPSVDDSSDSVASKKPYKTHVSKFSGEEGVMKKLPQTEDKLSIANQCLSTDQPVFGTGNQDPQLGAHHDMNYAAAVSEGNQGPRDARQSTLGKDRIETGQCSKPSTRSQTAAQ